MRISHERRRRRNTGFAARFCFPIKLGEEVLGSLSVSAAGWVNRTRSFCRCARESGGQLGQFIERKNAEESRPAE